jgi:hypothetical protein
LEKDAADFFCEERALFKLLQETRQSNFTYNHLEDCLRDMRRRHFDTHVHPDGFDVCCWKQAFQILPPLFGKPSHHFGDEIEDFEILDVKQAEDDAVHTIMIFRREATVSSREQAALYKLMEERDYMRKEMRSIDDVFKSWQESILGLPKNTFPCLVISDAETEDDGDSNPLTWSKEKLAKTRESVRKWKRQQLNIQQITDFDGHEHALAQLLDDPE